RIALLANHPKVDMLVVAGRVIGRPVREVLSPFGCLELGALDLALTETEVAALFDSSERPLDPATAELVTAQTAGWPAAADAIAAHCRATRTSLLDAPGVLRRGLVHHPVVDRVIRDTLGSLDPALADAMSRFGLLDRFTITAFDAVTEPGTVRALVEAGVPILEADDGWLFLPPILRRHLGGEIAGSDAERIAPHLAQSGGLLPAAHTLLASGSFATAEQLILNATRPQLDDVEAHDLIGVLDAIEPAVNTAALGIVRARAHETIGHVAEARRVIDETVTKANPASPGWTDVRLEQIRHALMVSDFDAAADENLLELSTPEHHTRRREIAGIRAAQSSNPGDVEQSIGLLEAAASEWQALGDPYRASHLLRAVAMIALLHLGRYPEAIDALTRARRLGWDRLYDRAATTTYLLHVAALSGRSDIVQRELPTAESLAATVRIPWLEPHIASAMVLDGVYQGHSAALAEWTRRAKTTLESEAHPTAVLFHAQLAQALAIAGDLNGASECLDEAQRCPGTNRLEVTLAEITLAARSGDTDHARALHDQLTADSTTPATRLWQAQLEIAIAANDRELADSATAVAQTLGLGDLAARLAAPANEAVAVQVLGGFGITIGGVSIAAPTGRPGELLKLLVCRGGTISLDQAIDELWDDCPSTDIGIRRLKNPINRLREVIGADAIIRTAAAIQLAPGVDTDLARFATAAGEATGRCGGDVVAAIDALNLYEPLLPDEPHSDLIANRSADVTATASGLFDLILRQPADRPSSTWLLETARRIDLFAEHWFSQIAQLAYDEHNLVHARQAIALARASAVELDLPDNPEVEDLALRLTH
ncbi:MAG: hypothetical protein AAGC53_17990, partial [Actinomycetota bacterium]